MNDLFRGQLVRLTMEEPEVIAPFEARWQRDSEFLRLVDDQPISLASEKKIRGWFEKDADDGFKPMRYPFTIRALEDDKPIGFIGLWFCLIHADAMVGIGIGDRAYWGRGFGTDAMKVALRYGFMELGLRRVSLSLFDYNSRALKSYEKAGFRIEGRTRGDILREGQRCDSLWMGILRDEWLSLNGISTGG